jgi:putative sterol carrier protein
MAAEDENGDERRVFLDLWHGECRLARAAASSDEAEARYILTGSSSSWRLVLTGKLAPLVAIMTGRLRLTKGSLAELIPYVDAAKELVMTAASIEATYPGEAGGGR